VEAPVTPLTPRQRAALDYICEHIETMQRAPTMRELAEHLGLTSTTGPGELVTHLARKGYVTRGGCARSIAVRRRSDGTPVRLMLVNTTMTKGAEAQ